MKWFGKVLSKTPPEGDHRESDIIQNARHFLQEDKGEEIAQQIDQYTRNQNSLI